MKELLLLLCRYPYDETNRETLSKTIGEVRDWLEMAELINAHGIIALAAYNIKEAKLEKEIPAAAMTILENGYRQSVVRNIWLTERWKEVNEILVKAGIRHILLKGMALEHTLYGSRGLRQMNDNDIFINREDSLRAWHLLQNEGFGYELPKSPLHLRMARDISYHLPALNKDGYTIEIHSSLFDYRTTTGTDYHDPFENTVEINVDNIKALIPSHDIHLKYLTDHFRKHEAAGECQLRIYTDILMLSEGYLPEFRESYLLNPDQRENPEFRKAAYRAKVNFIHPKYRLFFLLGDLFPSIRWMKQRYNCSTMKALLYYPHRLGKLLWLV